MGLSTTTNLYTTTNSEANIGLYFIVHSMFVFYFIAFSGFVSVT